MNLASRKLGSLIAIISVAGVAGIGQAARMTPEQVNYAGHFYPPPDQGGTAGQWSYGVQGLTLIPDCLGQPDPSPDDDYPGCIGAFGYLNAFQFGVFDLVPPGATAQVVVPLYALGSPVVETAHGYGGSANYWDVLYDRQGAECRLWWTFGDWFSLIGDDPPFLGVSSCDATAPAPLGIWDFGEEDAYRTGRTIRFTPPRCTRGCR